MLIVTHDILEHILYPLFAAGATEKSADIPFQDRILFDPFTIQNYLFVIVLGQQQTMHLVKYLVVDFEEQVCKASKFVPNFSFEASDHNVVQKN